MRETSKALQDLFYRYTHLPIGGKEIVCPYWMDKINKGVFGLMGGKGTPEDIVSLVYEKAADKGLDLNKLDEGAILRFLSECRIGVDCSGFVFWMLDALDRERGGNGIADNIPNSQGRFISPETNLFIKARANVKMLTEDGVSTPILLKEVKPGDMIRMKSGKHIAVVLKVMKNGSACELDYAHSSPLLGVHSASIKILDWEKGLEFQEWSEQIEFLPQVGDGIRRLKIFF